MKKALFLSAVAALMVVAGCSKATPETTTSTSTPTSQPTSQPPVVVAESMSVTTPPKTNYKVGETFSVDGGVITVTYSNQTTETFNMTSAMVPNPPSLAEAGSNVAVNVSYLGLTAKYYINIVDKITPTITLFCNGVEMDLEQTHWTKETPAASVYMVDDLPTMTYQISHSLTATVSYTVTDASEEEIYSGETLPSPLLEGTYTYKVSFTETADYKHVSEYALFKVTLKTKPTLSFSYNGNPLDLSSSHWVESSAKIYSPSEVPNVEYSVTPVVGANVSYVVNDDNEQQIYSGTTLPDPIVAGVYVMTVTTVETDDYLPVSNYVLFKMTDVEKTQPTLTLKVNGADLDTSSSHWTNGNAGASIYSSSEMPTLSYEMSDSLSATETWIVTDSNTETELYRGNTLPSPLIAGTYCYDVNYAGDDSYKPAHNWALFQVTLKVVPTMNILWDGNVLTFTTGAHWLDNEGYGASGLTRDEFKTKLSYECVYEDSPIVVGITVQIEKDEVVQQDWDIDTCTAGAYTMRVTSEETSDYFGSSNYVTFVVTD